MSTKTTAEKAQQALHSAIANPAWVILYGVLIAAAIAIAFVDVQLAAILGITAAVLFSGMVLVAAADLVLDTVNERKAR